MNKTGWSIYIVVFFGGLAALAWEVLWLHFASLAIGVSAQAAAIILSAMMLGMAAGSLVVESWLKNIQENKLLWLLAFVEGAIGLSGLFSSPLFLMVEKLDVWIFSTAPQFAPFIQSIGIVLILGLPTFLMGATVPVYARIANNFKISLAGLYATNVTGAAIGIMLVSFIFIPWFGISSTIKLSAGLNCLAALFALFAKSPNENVQIKTTNSVAEDKPMEYSLNKSSVIVFCTGFVIFVLEVVWFRSLRAALQATTESFALILFSTLIALACGGFLSSILKRSKRIPLSCLLALAGFLVLQITPIIERFDLYMLNISGSYGVYMLKRFFYVLIILGPPMGALGLGLPWILEMHNKSGRIGRLYSVNTLGAVSGSLVAAWIILPVLGSIKGAWVAAGIILLSSLLIARIKEYSLILILGLLGFFIACSNDSGLGHLRIQGWPYDKKYIVLESREGPDATVSVIEDEDHIRHLFIDGFSVSDESGAAHYMDWMGRLPMILHHHPKNALVICFGTGQTANSVRQENPEQLDLVDVNPDVFEMAPLFIKNQNVLNDPRTRKIIMDGRAFLRRTHQKYDIVTMEPMPPTFAGSNALYSLEFYQSINRRLNNNGIAAQWLPFHLVDDIQSASIVATFLEVFTDVMLWIDPVSNHGILLGFKREAGESRPVEWFGLNKGNQNRNLSDDEIKQSLIFHKDTLTRFAERGKIITDDNQFLSFGYGRMKWWAQPNAQKYTLDILNNIASQYNKQ